MDNLPQGNTWAEYQKLVLNKLESLENDLEALKNSNEVKYTDVKEKISDLKGRFLEFTLIKKELDELKDWKNKTQDVWSTSQMKESKDEIYRQKNKWYIVTGILAAIQVFWIVFTFFKKNGF